jgi:hypothetical protein
MCLRLSDNVSFSLSASMEGEFLISAAAVDLVFLAMGMLAMAWQRWCIVIYFLCR